jgi:hypothetical protein
MLYLREATAGQEIPLMDFLDTADFIASQTGLTIANTDIKIWKEGATSLVNKNSGGATHMADGSYYCTLDATDTNTIGNLVIKVNLTGSARIKVNCFVLEASAYDALTGGGAGSIPATLMYIDSAAANALADHILRRLASNIEASDNGDAIGLGSLYSLIQQAQESNTTANAGKITVFKTDGTTEVGQITAAGDGASVPIVGVTS